MAVMDEFKEEREQMKHQSLKKRLAYFWSYYKWYVLGGLLFLVVLTAFLKDMLTKKEDALYAAIVNGQAISDKDTLAKDFAEYAGIDTEKYQVSFNSSLRINETMDQSGIMTGQFLTVYTSAGDLDVSVMNPGNFDKYAYAGNFQDLSALLSDELLAKLSGRLYYVDAVIAQELDARRAEQLPEDDIVFPDPTKPDEMTTPVPVGIDLTGCDKFFDAYYYENGTAYLGIVVHSESPDMAVRFIEFLFP